MALGLSVFVVCFVGATFVVEGKTLIPASSVSLSDGGYSQVVVAIDESVGEDEAIITAIQRMFTDGSKYLYRATKKRIYFKDVTIVIPPTWQSKPGVYGSPGRMTFDTADVIVAPPNPLWSPSPYTHQIQGCGKPGSYIHFMKEFLTNPNFEKNYGNLGRVLVHEWGHYRWGLFNEYPDPVGDADHVTYFYQSTGWDQIWKAVSCSHEFYVRPMIAVESESGTKFRRCEGNDVSGYEEGCIGIPSDNAGATGSIMYGQLLFNDVADFCDSDESDTGNLHSREAVNKQNRLCDSKSSWEVMREHPDFKDGNSPPTNRSDDDIVPMFNLVQAKTADECRMVLVLDTSGSMGESDRIGRLMSAATAFTSLVSEGTWVGIVTFTGNYLIRQNLLQVNTQADRESLVGALDLVADGGTCIGCGLEGGIEVLSQHSSGSADGGIILLMTDGEDTSFDEHPVRLGLADYGVIVDTVAIGQHAYGKLNTVAQETGGSAFFYSDEGSSNELMNALTETAGRCGRSSGMNGQTDSIQIIGNRCELNIGESETGQFSLDPAIGNQTQIIVTYTMASSSTAGVIVIITQPDSVTIHPASSEYRIDIKNKVISIIIPGIAMSGTWTYSIENKFTGRQMQSATMSVYSRAVSAAEPTITVRSHLSESTLSLSDDVEALVAYAEVMQGFSPVIDATVNAIIERPGDQASDVIKLYDNGAGADITANDGVYTRSFTSYTGTGFYSVSIVAGNDGGAKVMDAAPESRSPMFINITEDGEIVSDLSIGNYSVQLPGTTKDIPYKAVANFSRSTSGGSTSVSSLPPAFVPGQDLFPPNRIQDLKIRSTSVHNLTVVLTWTAPGDDLDSGTASSYDIRMSNSSQTLRDNFENATQVSISDILQGNVSEPQPFGSVEEYTIRFPDIREAVSFSYAIAVRATDDGGLTGPVSNVAIVTFRRSIPTYQCGAKICQNGGKLNSENCTCICHDDYQGHLCQHVKSQLRNGVQLLFQANVSQLLTLLDPLLEGIADVLNQYCNQNFGRCCPDAKVKVSVELSAFVSADDIGVASAYPISAESDVNADGIGSYIVVFARQPDKTELCDGDTETNYLTKNTYADHGRIKRNTAEPKYVDPAILYDALQSGEEAIEEMLATTILAISFPVVEGDSMIVQTTTAPITGSTIPVWAIVVIVLVILTLGSVLVVVFCVRRRHARRSRQKDVAEKDKAESEVML